MLRVERRMADKERDASSSRALLDALSQLAKRHRCYVCRRRFLRAHSFYPRLCQGCGKLSYAKREQTADLGGRVAIVTGGRLRIGHMTALKLLRAGATVVVTTRFPKDAARRFGESPDFARWSQALHVYGLDFRFTRMVERFAEHVEQSYDRLDVLINNAAQTVRRPPVYYRHLLEHEQRPLSSLPPAERGVLEAGAGLAADTAKQPLLLTGPGAIEHEAGRDAGASSALLSQLQVIPGDEIADPLMFPEHRLNDAGEQIDLRKENSWTASLAHVEALECLEAQLINSVAPFVLCSRLKPLMSRHLARDKWIVNVTSPEGQFSAKKSAFHPHTNMAKAALNMLTRTSSEDYARNRIYMNSVDTGWISHQRPLPSQRGNHASPALDATDGAARVLDPIFTGVTTGRPFHGKLLKDFAAVDW
jgi:NAD(P)-dependent dehydrogenase (short-subunit alcohol dehydrogenase family)